MAPKRTRTEVSSPVEPDAALPDEQDLSKRPRKSARTAAGESEQVSATSSAPGGGVSESVDKTAEASDSTASSTPTVITASEEDRITTTAAPMPPTPSSGPSVDDPRSFFMGIDYVPDETIERLLPFARKVDTVNHRYALACIPANATWGTTKDTEGYLCVDDKPITIWYVGNTQSPWFVDASGEPHPRVNIGCRLPYKGDYGVVKRLYEKGRPRRTDLGDVVYSAKRMTTYGSKTGKTIVPFKGIYDATERFKAKSSMAVLPSGVLGRRDIVLVESLFARWRTERDKENRRKWVKWNVALELQAVNLLFEAPPDLVEEMEKEPEPARDFEDDIFPIPPPSHPSLFGSAFVPTVPVPARYVHLQRPQLPVSQSDPRLCAALFARLLSAPYASNVDTGIDCNYIAPTSPVNEHGHPALLPITLSAASATPLRSQTYLARWPWMAPYHASPPTMAFTLASAHPPVKRGCQLPCWLQGIALKRIVITASSGGFFPSICPIHLLPASATWGEDQNHSSLCVQNSPVTMSVVGSFQCYRVSHGDDEVPRLHVTIDMVRDVDVDGYCALQAMQTRSRAKPVKALTASRSLYALCPNFPPLLDGTNRSLPNDMRRCTWRNLRGGDIVMLEFAFERRVMDEVWTAGPVLTRLTLLARAPSS